MTPIRYCTTDDDTALQKLMCNDEVSCSSMEEFQRQSWVLWNTRSVEMWLATSYVHTNIILSLALMRSAMSIIIIVILYTTASELLSVIIIYVKTILLPVYYHNLHNLIALCYTFIIPVNFAMLCILVS